MKRRLIQADDMEPGKYVTVHKGESVDQPMGDQMVQVGEHYFRLKGIPLKIVAVERPYIAVEVLSGAAAGCRAELDTRLAEFMEIGADYAEALRPRKQSKRWWQFWRK